MNWKVAHPANPEVWGVRRAAMYQEIPQFPQGSALIRLDPINSKLKKLPGLGAYWVIMEQVMGTGWLWKRKTFTIILFNKTFKL